MASNPATTADLVARSLRTLSAQELQVGAALLEDVWNQILTRVPSVAARLDAIPQDTVFRNLVVAVECSAVLRVLSNPDGRREERVDDYSYVIDAARSTGSLYLTDEEIDILGSGDAVSDAAFTIRPFSNQKNELPGWF